MQVMTYNYACSTIELVPLIYKNKYTLSTVKQVKCNNSYVYPYYYANDQYKNLHNLIIVVHIPFNLLRNY
jgi:hypothetical protein